jgi:hypothetical protein
MRGVLFLLIVWLAGSACFAQNLVQKRVILIGDAGEINPKQHEALTSAAAHIIPGKSIVMFLGDNIYPHGMGLPGSAEEKQTQEIIRAQFTPMRAVGAPTCFVPGNHDWDRSGAQGLAKIKRQGEFLREQNDPGLELIPAGGCPGPVEVPLGDSLLVMVFDSEWWLFPHQKTGPADSCACNSKEEVLTRMQSIRDRNAGKFIVLASHHPFRSYGTHGGKYSLKDHIFPLTAVKKWLWVPLPVIGSLYPLLRSKIKNPEDMGHAWYQDMIGRVSQVFDGRGGVVFAAGHEHGLQLIDDGILQVVSGSGAKRSYARKGKHSLFAHAKQGFVTIDLLQNKSLLITYYVVEGNTVRSAFSYPVTMEAD